MTNGERHSKLKLDVLDAAYDRVEEGERRAEKGAWEMMMEETQRN